MAGVGQGGCGLNSAEWTEVALPTALGERELPLPVPCGEAPGHPQYLSREGGLGEPEGFSPMR